MICNLFKLIGIERPSYLDLGAYHPYAISNTALLYLAGSRGVNVEANPYLAADLRAGRAEDINLSLGVGVEAGNFPFYMYSETSGLNTFSEARTNAHEAKRAVSRVIHVPVLTLDEIVSLHCGSEYPDLLSSDLEGIDFEVIESADFSRSRPKVVVAEIGRAQAAAMTAMMCQRGYLLVCRMVSNLIFVQNAYKGLVY